MPPTTVTFGGVDGTDVTVTSATELTVVVPPGADAGPVDVTVTTSAGSGSLAGGYTYMAEPVATSLDPDTGPAAGGTEVTLTGTGFVADETTVTVGGTDATVSAVGPDGTTVTFTTPAGTGAADVVVTTPGGSSTLTGAFTYVAAPTATAIDPDSGPVAGGNTVTITGTGFEE